MRKSKRVGKPGARYAALLAGTAFLTGCSVGPDFKRPSVWSPAGWQTHDKNMAGDRPAPTTSVVVADPPETRWWGIFNDPELSALEDRVARSNLDVRLAGIRLAESRAQLRITGADRYPTLTGNGSYAYTKISDKLIQRGLSNGLDDLPLPGPTLDAAKAYAGGVSTPALNIWEDGISASWELDIWGRVRREVEQGRANVTASEEDRRSVLIMRLAEMARDYMLLRGTQSQLLIARENQKTAEETLKLSQERFTGGLTTQLDVENARAQLDTTTAQIPNFEQQISQQVNAISLLLGEPPQALLAELEVNEPVPPVPPRVPVGVPSELARRRPDVREAEARLHAATAGVGVAVADFYPRVTLTGALNFQSLAYRDLAFWPAAAYNAGPSISLPIFQGGRLRGQLQLTKAQQEEAAISYQQTVLSAWHDVDNALTAYGAEQRRRDQLASSVDAARRALDLAREQYAHGLQTFLNVLDAQRTLLSAQQQLTTSTQTVSSNLVQLYAALGGGWEATFPARLDADGMQRTASR
ncbi:efflux transporter outer membrane subunit [Rhizosaccharibacter radicis]|uniref:Efflux transporter outer membrane subunit n=1 Tax=Rhizosaccharibacter radicis TaxID=2782605 RepID=A0ABT1W1R2_9PROT|nr:efflux transporter outer membrane subunit [Acetobacteraceae bacterium KSS12]